MFYDVRNPLGMLGKRCCCLNYRGELFNFTCTIDEPWNNGLANPRNSIYKSWMKTVNQEVRFWGRGISHFTFFNALFHSESHSCNILQLSQ
jgi:hypothetical protein